ncbi:hypothetical protein [Streptomyces sp. MMG1121]|uniref:hypothetical protein n=1 Tax=Streptomyces sp. MMG1121 TaxID=1415544 RepID=UPI0007C698B9|nr:hypothetical protein [Streptomyces sp. MMG1121]
MSAGRRADELRYRPEHFVVDGALRDVCVLGTTLDDWRRMTEGLRVLPGRHVLTWTLAGTTDTGVPDASAVWARLEQDPEESVSLAVEIGGMWFTSYFFEIEEIGFTFDPRAVVDRNTFAPVRDFVTWLGTSTGREVVVTMESTDHTTLPAMLRRRPPATCEADPGHGTNGSRAIPRRSRPC